MRVFNAHPPDGYTHGSTLPHLERNNFAMRFDRALSLARYNWPLYLICMITALAGIAAAATPLLPTWIRVVAALGGVIACWYAVASFWAFHVMFDRSDFLSGRWLARCIDDSPNRCVQLSVCLEETTLPIEEVFPAARCTNLDLYDDTVMTEPAIARAKQVAGASAALPAKPSALPLANDFADLTIVTLAAHEVRDRSQREVLFQELQRITDTKGQLVLAEHLRNVPAALAFGPGMFHFYPRSQWTSLAEKTGWMIEKEFDITPFFHVFVMKRA